MDFTKATMSFVIYFFGLILRDKLLFFELFSFEEQKGHKMDDEVHLRNTFQSGVKLVEHFGVAVDSLVEMHAGE
jgi:hypothetical protein